VADEVTIKFDIDSICDKSESEKLDLLLRIAFSNHQTLVRHGAILFGNGKEGLCDISRWNKRMIGILYGALGTSILTFAGFFFAHVSK